LFLEVICFFSDKAVNYKKGESISAKFICEKGKWMNVIFFKNGRPMANLDLSDGRSFVLYQGISGSGARYITPDEKHVLWVKGNTAFFEENGRKTYQGETPNQ